MSKYHMSVSGSPAGCVAVIRSCPRGGEESYLRFVGVEGPARATVKELRGNQDRFYEKHGLGKETDTVEKVVDFKDMSVEERVEVASNTSDGSILSELASDEDVSVRENVAKNPNTSGSVLKKLGNDPYGDIKGRARSHPNYPDNYLNSYKFKKGDASTMLNERKQTILAKDSMTSLEVLSELAKVDNPRVRSQVALNPSTPEGVLEDLARDEKVQVRSYVATNEKLSKKTLDILSVDEALPVRECVAGNPNTSRETLEKLSKDKDDQVREAVASNPNW